MKNGIYALASLDGRPLAQADLAVMALDDAAGPIVHAVPGCTLAARDVRPAAIHVRQHGEGMDALLGDLDEPGDLADLLGLPRGTDPLALACAAADRFGAAAPARMIGAWLLVRWHAPGATLDLLMSDRVRDTCYVATDGARVAIAPELVRLSRLDWVGDTLDPRGVFLTLGRAPLRRGLGSATTLRAVTRMLPGTCVTVRAGDVRTSVAAPPATPPVRAESFETWLAMIEAQLRLILRQLIQRHGRVAIMLSGGLDSSLLALLASLESPGAIIALTSAAPRGSGLLDEAGRARKTADHLGLPIHDVMPLPGAQAYRPSLRTLRSVERPIFSARHYLDDAFVDAAIGHGVGTLIDGSGGEFGVTSFAYFFETRSALQRLRGLARRARDAMVGPPATEAWPQAGFHARLSRDALARMPADLAGVWRRGQLADPRLRSDAALGVDPGVAKMALVPTATLAPEVRALLPYLDRRMVDLMAAMPTGFTVRDGVSRAPARALLRDRVPAGVWQRITGRAFSPAHEMMMRAQADDALQRIAVHRANGVDEWIDLEWLEAALRRQAQAGDSQIMADFEVQATALAAEFFTWWNTGRS